MRALIVLAALVPALLAACTAGPSSRPAIVQQDGAPRQEQPPAPRAVPLPPLEEPAVQAINWRDCDAETRARLGQRGVPDSLDFSCAGVLTTLDAPDLPQRGVKRIAVLKVGSGPVPLAVLNDIDGAPGTLHAARLAAQLPPEFLQRFSLIGVDRRGSGQSNPIDCIPPEVRPRLLGHDPAAGDVGPLLDAARTAGQQCAIDLESEQAAYDSWRAAGDLEQLRRQLGVPHLNAIARGEGSRVLIAYAERFAGHVGRFVLDGIPDPSADPTSVLAGVAEGALATLDAFGAGARQAVGDLVDSLRSSPKVTPSGQVMGPALALHAVRQGLRDRDRWPELAEAIDAARAGDVAGLAAFVAPFLTDSALRPSRLGASIATLCNDTSSRLPADRINRVIADLQAKHPLFGGIIAQRLAWCSPWPARDNPTGARGVTGVPPMLVTSTASDPVTPEQGTARAAAQLPGAVRVAWQGAGHGALDSPCVLDAVRGFLVDGTVPEQGVLCPA